jgi:putative ABC transport system substrate-binding protein
MRRREFITLLGGAAAVWPLVARAQQPERMRRVGVLIAIAENDPQAPPRVAAIKNGLRERGWIDGRNVRLDFRFSGEDAENLRVIASELVGLNTDAIFVGNTTALAAVHRETRTIPIVFAQVDDPVRGGFVASLARPGGNVTGFALFEETIAVKWLELVKQIAPSVARVAIIYDPANPSWSGYLRTIEAGAPSFGVQVLGSAVRDADELQRAIDSFAGEPNGGLIVLAGPVTATYREQIIGLAVRHRLPAVYPYRYFVTAGGLASYGADNIDLYRRAMSYVDRILKGEKPAELPVQTPTKYELVINLKTAKVLGLDLPISLLARTDEVIE